MTTIVDLATHPEKHVTVAELATYWKVSERAIQYWVAKGALPAMKVGTRIRILTMDARRFGRIDDIVTGPIGSL
jgi:excisionase family DNA binding protein